MFKIIPHSKQHIFCSIIVITLGLGAILFSTIAYQLVPSAYAFSWHHVHLNLNLHQFLAQLNRCIDQDTQCFNSGNNQVNIHFPHDKSWISNGNIGQSLSQENDCSKGSTCINSGSNNADLNIDQHHGVDSRDAFKIDQSLSQENDCSKGSTCINSGSNNINIG